MKSRKVIIAFVSLVLLCGVFAYFHLNSYEEIPENALKITTIDEEIYIDIDTLEYTQVSGVRVNGKGEEIEVNGLGIALSDLLNQEGIHNFTTVRVEAEDAYQASIDVSEIHRAYFLKEERLRLVIFEDTNSKRSVSNIVEIIIE